MNENKINPGHFLLGLLIVFMSMSVLFIPAIALAYYFRNREKSLYWGLLVGLSFPFGTLILFLMSLLFFGVIVGLNGGPSSGDHVMVTKIEGIKANQGRYPESLEQLKTPNISSSIYLYDAHTDNFELCRYQDWFDGIVFNGTCYSSMTQEWKGISPEEVRQKLNQDTKRFRNDGSDYSF